MTMGRGGIFGFPHQVGMGGFGGFGLPKRPIGTGGVFGGEFEDEPYAQQPAPQKRGGFFGEGGAGRGIAGTIGDYLLQMSGARPIYAPAMQQKQAMAFAEQQRKQAMQDQKELLNYKAGLQGPEAIPLEQQYEYIKRTQGKAAADLFIQNKINPPVWRTDAYGQAYRVDTGPQAFGSYNPDEWEVVK